MRSAQPIIRTFRRQLQGFPVVVLSRNWRLRRIVYLSDKLECLLDCQGVFVNDSAALSGSASLIRYPDSIAIKTTIANTGSGSVVITEDGVIVLILAAGKSGSWPGRGVIRGYTLSGSATVKICTQRRCLCGDTDSPYVSTIDPTDGELV